MPKMNADDIAPDLATWIANSIGFEADTLECSDADVPALTDCIRRAIAAFVPKAEGQDLEDPACSACGEVCHWNDEADRDDPDPLCNPCAQRIASEYRQALRRSRLGRTPEETAALKAELRDVARARKARIERTRETEAERQVRRCAEALGYVGEPDRLAVAVGDACLAFAKDLREINARYMVRIKRLEVAADETSQYLRDFEASLVSAGRWDAQPELPLNLLAREIVAQAERWRIDAEHYRGEASNATAAMVESLSAEVARLTGEVAATRSEAARQIGARDAELAALVTRAHRLTADITNEANECTAHGLVSPATALRGAAAFLTSVGERVPRVFSAASSVEALHQRLEEADRHLAGLQEELRRRDEALREETRKVIEYSNLVDQYNLALARVQNMSAAAVSAALDPSSGATTLRHSLAAQLRVAAKTASAWEEAAIREWAPLALDYHDGDGTVTAAIEGPYLEHRLVMAWRGQVQRMAENLSADESPTNPIQRLDYTLLPLGYTMEEDVDADDVSICLWLWSSDADTDGRSKRFGVECTAEADAIADAWCDWKKSNDPPGLTVESFEDGASWIRGTPDLKRWDSPDEARAAAWAWYDRRLALTDRLDRPADPRRHGVDPHLIEHHPEVSTARLCKGWWPRCLTWSDTQVAEVERWLVDSTAEMPEVLRG